MCVSAKSPRLVAAGGTREAGTPQDHRARNGTAGVLERASLWRPQVILALRHPSAAERPQRHLALRKSRADWPLQAGIKARETWASDSQGSSGKVCPGRREHPLRSRAGEAASAARSEGLAGLQADVPASLGRVLGAAGGKINRHWAPFSEQPQTLTPETGCQKEQ